MHICIVHSYISFMYLQPSNRIYFAFSVQQMYCYNIFNFISKSVSFVSSTCFVKKWEFNIFKESELVLSLLNLTATPVNRDHKLISLNRYCSALFWIFFSWILIVTIYRTVPSKFNPSCNTVALAIVHKLNWKILKYIKREIKPGNWSSL